MSQSVIEAIDRLSEILSNKELLENHVWNGDANNTAVPTPTPIVTSLKTTDGVDILYIGSFSISHLTRLQSIHFLADGSINFVPSQGKNVYEDSTRLLAYNYTSADQGKAFGVDTGGNIAMLPVGGGGSSQTFDNWDVNSLPTSQTINITDMPDVLFLQNNASGTGPTKSIEIFANDLNDRLITIYLNDGEISRTSFTFNDGTNDVWYGYYSGVHHLMIKNGVFVGITRYLTGHAEGYSHIGTYWYND